MYIMKLLTESTTRQFCYNCCSNHRLHFVASGTFFQSQAKAKLWKALGMTYTSTIIWHSKMLKNKCWACCDWIVLDVWIDFQSLEQDERHLTLYPPFKICHIVIVIQATDLNNFGNELITITWREKQYLVNQYLTLREISHSFPLI